MESRGPWIIIYSSKTGFAFSSKACCMYHPDYPEVPCSLSTLQHHLIICFDCRDCREQSWLLQIYTGTPWFSLPCQEILPVIYYIWLQVFEVNHFMVLLFLKQIGWWTLSSLFTMHSVFLALIIRPTFAC